MEIKEELFRSVKIRKDYITFTLDNYEVVDIYKNGIIIIGAIVDGEVCEIFPDQFNEIIRVRTLFLKEKDNVYNG